MIRIALLLQGDVAVGNKLYISMDFGWLNQLGLVQITY